MDYHKINSCPEKNGWVRFLQDRILFSFKTIRKRKQDGKVRYILDEPILNRAPFGKAHNLWTRAIAFYAAGKIADVHSLGQLMKGLRQAWINQISHDPVGCAAILAGMRNDIWDSVQLERLWALLNTNRLDCERASTAHIMQALEFILKAVAIHCNYHCANKFYFRGGHDLGKLYGCLPCGCKSEFEQEAAKFFREFRNEREETQQKINLFPSLDLSQDESKLREDARVCFRDMEDIVAGKKYFDMVNNEGIPNEDEENKDWIFQTLRGAGNWINHRYGPTPRGTDEEISAVDSYCVDEIYSAQLVARFFLEHLFSFENVVQTESRSNP